MKIQVIPQGILSLLGITGDGQNPTELAATVVPIIDMTPRYNSRLLVTKTAGPSVLNALGQGITMTVPAGEAWDIVAVGFTAGLLAGALTPSLEININGCVVEATDVGSDTTRANPAEMAIGVMPPALVLSPGMTIAGFLRSTPNSNITALLRALVRVMVV